MKVRKYVIYLVISFLIMSLFCFAIKQPLSIAVWINIYLILLILRVTDNIYDYEKDLAYKNTLYSKKQLYQLNAVFNSLFFILNIYLYKSLGLLSIVFIGYVFLQEKHKVLQPFLMMFLSLYLLRTYSFSIASMNVRIYGFLIVTIILPLFFGVYKRSKNNDLSFEEEAEGDQRCRRESL